MGRTGPDANNRYFRDMRSVDHLPVAAHKALAPRDERTRG